MHGPVVVYRGCSSQYPDDIGVLVWVRGTFVWWAGTVEGFLVWYGRRIEVVQSADRRTHSGYLRLILECSVGRIDRAVTIPPFAHLSYSPTLLAPAHLEGLHTIQISRKLQE